MEDFKTSLIIGLIGAIVIVSTGNDDGMNPMMIGAILTASVWVIISTIRHFGWCKEL